jgi:CRP-like cAMP-binding protein
MPSFTDSDRFSRLDRRDRDRLEALAKLDQFSAGQEVIAGGAKSEWVSLIVTGAVELRARSGGRDVVLASLGPGDLFGEVETFGALPAEVRHVARENTVVRAISKNPLRHELRANPRLAAGLLLAYCRSISEKIRPASEAAARNAPVAGRFQSRPPAGPRASHVSEEEAKWLSLLGQRVELAAGQVAVAEGDESRSFYLLERGAAEVRKRTPDGERVLAQLGPGDLFGIMAFVDGKPRSASVVMTDGGSCIKVDPDALERAAGMNFTVSFKFLGTLCSVMARILCETARQVAGPA